MSSIIFNPAMLTVSPSPSPEPEEHPLEGGNASVDDATLDDAAPKEPEESESDWIERAWAAVLNTMHVCIETAPPSKPKLLEEQESWLRDWNVAMADIYERARAASLHVSLNDAENVTLAEGKIATRMLTRAVKAWKEKAEESAVTVRPAHAEKGKVKEVVASEETAEKVTEKSGEKAPKPVLTDMGHLCLGGRMTATSVSHPAERCECCAASGAKCIVVQPSGRCEGCVKVRKGCSFVAAKNKGCVLAVPKRKAPPSAQTTAPETGYSREPVAGTSKEAIFVQWPKRPLASAAAPAAKCPRLDANTELDEARAESAQLCAENAELRTRNNKYRVALTEMHQHSRTQESELLHMSNRLYLLARDWGTWEKELCKVLEE
ncbi:uncharacterized protein F5147DRAFT_789698 [Suillus discolor]|uniref:Uncharacterized protein n=1 Tax=Suillus discolor TaxID=1912936 RepID=A0A9P7ETS1_9AGAM|nr:uncharacterized protein F5147DRAFT_789698 [Suillus discolor]KAG2087995.1 hypothetical protein F5147DRAFT_789698 [Suillus discolor]